MSLDKKLSKLLKIPNKEQFRKHLEILIKRNKRIVKEGNRSQLPNNETFLIRFV